MRKTIYETNYDRLIKLGVVSKEGVVPDQTRRSEVSNLMDWVVERLPALDGASE